MKHTFPESSRRPDSGLVSKVDFDQQSFSSTFITSDGSCCFESILMFDSILDVNIDLNIEK
jgi:hypothetical protein